LPKDVIGAGAGSIWLGTHKIMGTNIQGGKPDFISVAYTRDDVIFAWNGTQNPDLRYIAWKENLEADSVGVDYGESVRKADGQWDWWKVQFTAPMSGPPDPSP
jgi:hypothetical protein